MTVIVETQLREKRDLLKEGISTNKFHRVYSKELTIALESTLDATFSGELVTDPDIYEANPDLLFSKGNCWRAYYPARNEGDISTDAEAKINFIPWFSGPEVLYNRLAFRCRPIEGRVYRWMAFARFDDKTPTFSFNLLKPYINLDFFGCFMDKQGKAVVKDFKPLFVKVKADSGALLYLVVEGQWGEAGPNLSIRRSVESEVPLPLVNAKPEFF